MHTVAHPKNLFSRLPAMRGENSTSLNWPALIGPGIWRVFSVRQGPWKWIEAEPATVKESLTATGRLHPQFYNLNNGPQDTQGLISERPETAANLFAVGEQYRPLSHSRN